MSSCGIYVVIYSEPNKIDRHLAKTITAVEIQLVNKKTVGKVLRCYGTGTRKIRVDGKIRSNCEPF